MLNDYLKKYRLDNNLTQKQMSERLNTSQAYYSRIESGNKKPGIAMVGRIAKLLGVEPQFVRSLL